MEQKTLQHIEDNAILRAINTQLDIQGRDVLVLPADAKVHDLEYLNGVRRRFRGKFTTEAIEAFANYCHQHVQEQVEAGCFIEADSMVATAVLDLGNVGEPQHGDHVALLTLKKTAAYRALLGVDGEVLSQKQLAEWIEDWMPNLAARRSLDDALTIPRAVASIRKVTIKALRETGNEDRNFGASRSTFEQVEADNEENPLPAFLDFTCTPYHGLEDREFHLRVSLMTSGDEPKFRLRLVQHEEAQEDMAEEFSELLKRQIAGSVPVTIGQLSLRN